MPFFVFSYRRFFEPEAESVLTEGSCAFLRAHLLRACLQEFGAQFGSGESRAARLCLGVEVEHLVFCPFLVDRT